MKKVLKNFRIRVDLVESLKAKSKAVGIPETQFVEELLDEYLEKKFNEHAKARSAAIGKIQKPRKGNPRAKSFRSASIFWTPPTAWLPLRVSWKFST